uniref:Uncharacterized protein n=1 Tax=Scleropages formosus TaxID=113540 RepID=A0A8C9RUD8_SCLFO
LHAYLWCGDEDDLEHPESDVRDGERLIVADILATRLQGVAHKIRLLVPPYELGFTHGWQLKAVNQALQEFLSVAVFIVFIFLHRLPCNSYAGTQDIKLAGV